MGESSNRKFELKNYLGQFFDNVINIFKRIILFTFGNILPLLPSSIDVYDSTSNEDEKFFEIPVSEELIKKLHEKFSDSDANFQSKFESTIQIPVALGRQLYAAYLESILQQIDVHDQIIYDSIKEDEEFERKLEELEETDNLFAIYTVAGEEEVDAAKISQQSLDYRKEAQRHLEYKRIYKERAEAYLKAGNKTGAEHYFHKAKDHGERAKYANKLAADNILKENSKYIHNKNCIDFHGLYVNEAINALDKCIDKRITLLKNNLNTGGIIPLTVITGRGKHSVGGIAKIKPAVIERLKERGLRFYPINEGCLQVHINKNSVLTRVSI